MGCSDIFFCEQLLFDWSVSVPTGGMGRLDSVFGEKLPFG
jgi:hypothetical protein